MVVATLITVLAAACTQSTGSGTTPLPASPTAGAPVPTVVRDVAYGADPLQELDFYLPSGDGPFPVLLYLHSGGWIAGSHRFVPDFVTDQVARGYAVVAVDYRLAERTPDGTVTDAFPASAEDVDTGVRFVRAHAAEWSLDPDQILLAGASAGGHLVLLAAAAPGRFVAPDLTPALQWVSPTVQGVLAFVAPSDLVAFVAEDNELAEASLTGLLGCPTEESTSCDLDRAAAASPATYLDASAPPAWFAYGAHDTLAPVATQGLPIAVAWAAARGEVLGSPGALVQFHVEDAGHNLDRDTVDLAALEHWLDVVTGRAS